MNTPFTLQDTLSISPLLILLWGGILLVLIESWNETFSRKTAFIVGELTIVLAFIANILAPPIVHPLLVPFISSDSFSRIFTSFFLLVGFTSLSISYTFFKGKKESLGEYHFLIISSLSGLLLIAASQDFLTLFLGLEIVSIALYILVAYMKSWNEAHEAAIKYFLLGSLATAVFLFGVGLLYGALGSTEFHDLLKRFQNLGSLHQILFLGGASLITLGLFFKAAVIPFHVWAPDVYEGASSPVTAFLAVASKAGGFAGLARIFLLTLPSFDPRWNSAVAVFSGATLIYANFLAIRQTSFRRFFAYSGIAHSGFLLIPLAAGGEDALSTLLFYLFVYAIATMGAFTALTAIDTGLADVKLTELQGLFSKKPSVALVLSLCLLTLSGFPPFIGFFAKFALFKTAYQAGLISLMIVGLLMTVFSLYYYLRIIGMMFQTPKEEFALQKGSYPSLALSLASFLLLLYFTIFPDTIHWLALISR